jgi:hypothetical protein
MAVPVSSGSLNVQQNMAFKNQSALPNGGELIRCKFFRQSSDAVFRIHPGAKSPDYQAHDSRTIYAL